MAGYLGTRAVLLSTTAATVTGDMTVTGDATVSGAFTSLGIDDNATSTAITIDASENVGIGTSSPVNYSNQTSLTVDGTSVSRVDLRAGGADKGTVLGNAAGIYMVGGYGLNATIQGGTNGSVTAVTQGVERMQIDASGRVTTPYQPIISGQIGSTGNVVGPQLIPFNDFWVSRGITYSSSTRRFTVPVGGCYRITLNPFFLTNVAAARVLVGVNSDAPTTTSHYGHCYRADPTYDTGCINSVVTLSANDYITFYVQQGTLYNAYSDRFTQFSIELIG